MKNESTIIIIGCLILCGVQSSPGYAERLPRPHEADGADRYHASAAANRPTAPPESALRSPVYAAGPSLASATSETRGADGQVWGIAAAGRLASVPFAVGGDSATASLVPMLFYENDYFFLRGSEGGAHLFNASTVPVEVSALSRLRFVDLPADRRNALDEDSIDFGLQLRYDAPARPTVDLELMSDRDARLHANLRLAQTHAFGDWQLTPNVTVRYKDADFNTTYYALDTFYGERIGDGIDASIGLDALYHLANNFYLLGATNLRRLDDAAYDSRAVADRYEASVLFGLGYFENQSSARKSSLTNDRYVRIAHGWATPSNIGDILAGKTEKDRYNNQLTSLFYGHPLADDVLGRPLDIYLTPGVVHHWPSSRQSTLTEYVAAIKAYYTFEWPLQWRFGVAEGFSYIDDVTYIEASEMARKEYKPSRLLNYLDFSLDLNAGTLFNRPAWRHVWVGYSIHHRSAIFEKASQYGRIKGGSNYNTLYLQFDF